MNTPDSQAILDEPQGSAPKKKPQAKRPIMRPSRGANRTIYRRHIGAKQLKKKGLMVITSWGHSSSDEPFIVAGRQEDTKDLAIAHFDSDEGLEAESELIRIEDAWEYGL
jgi:hypothetical protein